MENIESSWNILMVINIKILQSKYFNNIFSTYNITVENLLKYLLWKFLKLITINNFYEIVRIYLVSHRILTTKFIEIIVLLLHFVGTCSWQQWKWTYSIDKSIDKIDIDNWW